MKRKIMITLDGSELSKQVLPEIQRLFTATDTELILLQVIDSLAYSPYITPMTPALTWDPQLIEQEWIDHRRVIVDQMNEVAHAMERLGYHVRVHVLVGNPVTEICTLASDEKVDLLAMATHGRSGILRMVMGSVSEGVLRSTTVPLLLLHPTKSKEEKEEKEEASKPAFMIDLEQKSPKAEVVYETPSF